MDSPVKQKKASHYIANKKLHIIAKKKIFQSYYLIKYGKDLFNITVTEYLKRQPEVGASSPKGPQ